MLIKSMLRRSTEAMGAAILSLPSARKHYTVRARASRLSGSFHYNQDAKQKQCDIVS